VTGTDGTATGTATLVVDPAAPASLTLSPSTSTVTAATAQSYTDTGVDGYANPTGDVTSQTVFSIAPDGSGSPVGASCATNSCSATTAGTYTVTGTDGTATGTATLVVDPAAPTATTAPSIPGTPADGTSVTGDPGVWSSPDTLSYTYQWSDCPTATFDATTCTPIAAATGLSYTPSYLDYGQYLAFAVTATDQHNQSTTNIAMSLSAVGPPSPPLNLTLPVLPSGPVYKTVVVKVPGTWSSPDPLSFARQWERCSTDSLSSCTAISGATTGHEYRPTAADIGDYLTQRVTASDKENQSTTIYTNLIGPVTGPQPPTNLTAPTITGTGTPTVGSTLTATRGTWYSPDPLRYTYQWQYCTSTAVCTDIAGATHRTYTPTKNRTGETVTVTVTATDTTALPTPDYTQATSNPTNAVQPK